MFVVVYFRFLQLPLLLDSNHLEVWLNVPTFLEEHLQMQTVQQEFFQLLWHLNLIGLERFELLQCFDLMKIIGFPDALE